MINTKLVKNWQPVIKKVVVNGTKHYKPILTPKQYNTLTKWMIGKLTQSKMGDNLLVNQTTVHKTLFGNIDYAHNKKRYGGIFRKIEKYETGQYNVNNNILRKK
jgi:hypothetical protein